MQSVLHSFAYGLDYLREQVADVPPADMAAQPAGFCNHPAWVIGHLALTCQELAAVIDLPAWLPPDWPGRFGAGSVPVADPGAYEPKDQLLARLAEAQEKMTRGIQRLGPAELARAFPDAAFQQIFPSLGHAFTQVLVGHTAYHVGQVTLWRRAMGLPKLTRAFE